MANERRGIVILISSDSEVENTSIKSQYSPPSHSHSQANHDHRHHRERSSKQSSPASSLCPKHQHANLQKSRPASTSLAPIVISSDSPSDVEVIGHVNIKVPVHTCSSRVHEVKHSPPPSSSAVHSSPAKSPATTPVSNRLVQQSLLVHTCTKHRGITPPIAAVRPQPRSGHNADHAAAGPPAISPSTVQNRQSPSISHQGVNDPITSPRSSQDTSPTKRLLSVKRRNQLHLSLVKKQPASSSSDSDAEFEKSPANRAKRKKHHRSQKENVHSGSTSRLHRQLPPKTSPSTMYLDKDTCITHSNSTVASMPVSRTSDILPVADLPWQPADDASGGHRLKKKSPFEKSDIPHKKRRTESVYLASPVSDSDNDEEMAMVNWKRSSPAQVESRQDMSSPEYQDLSRRALQENAQMRNDSHYRIASPHRSPLQVTQDQATFPKSHAFQRRTESGL
ncbi:uncharacterized protein [Amphiura filiformis]|uniref:uncharacterized protein n=1 Tax=Amphiura filiformis TaxID=82378 RepID=UPI003B21F318